MARARDRLTVKSVEALKSPGLHADGGGLYLNVKKSGARSWCCIFQWQGKRREAGLGPLHIVSLQDARDKRDQLRRLVRDGIDPLAEKTAPKSVPTFGAVATALVDTLEAGWVNPKHRQQWRNTLETYCEPFWNRPVDEVGTADIVDVLKPIWIEKRETATRLRSRIERVLDAAKVNGHLTGDNPARWRGHLQAILPINTRTKTNHHAALPYDQVPDFVKGLGPRLSTAARALEFLIYTAARTGEVLGAVWGEVDMAAKTWTVPASRMKMKREHVVPLTEPALVVFRAMAIAGTKPDAPIFPTPKGKPLSNMAMPMLLRRMECDGGTVHGFRSAFRDWAGDKTAFPREVAEAALAHIVGSAVEQAYRRGSALEKRRELMEAWSEFVVGEVD